MTALVVMSHHLTPQGAQSVHFLASRYDRSPNTPPIDQSYAADFVARKRYLVYRAVVTDPHDLAWRRLLETYSRTVRTLEKELADECDLPLTWYDALVQLHEAGGTMRVGDLAAHLLISRSATTRFVDRLERNDLIERRVLDSDRRGMLVILTAHGRATLRTAAPTHLRGIKEHFSSKLSDAQAADLARLLGGLLDS